MVYIASVLQAFTTSIFITLGTYIVSWSGIGYTVTYGLFSLFFGIFGIMIVLLTFVQALSWAFNIHELDESNIKNNYHDYLNK